MRQRQRTLDADQPSGRKGGEPSSAAEPSDRGLNVTPSVLRWARESSGFSVEEAARKAQLAGELREAAVRLESLESTGGLLTLPTLERLANVYKRPLSAFLLAAPPQEPPAIKDFRRLPTREGGRLLDPPTRLAIRTARRVQRIAAELAQELRVSAKPSIPTFPRDVSIKDAERLAADVSNRLWTHDNPRPTGGERLFSRLRECLEESNLLVFQFKADLEVARGFSLQADVFPLLAANANDSPSAKNFTLLHELAHVLRQSVGLCLPDSTTEDGRVEPIETFCNYFAGYALVPTHELESEWSRVRDKDQPQLDEIQQIARHFGASITVTVRRLLTQRLVTRSFYLAHSSESRRSEREQRTRESGYVEPARLRLSEYGRRYLDLVLRAHADGAIDASTFADYSGLKLERRERLAAITYR